MACRRHAWCCLEEMYLRIVSKQVVRQRQVCSRPVFLAVSQFLGSKPHPICPDIRRHKNHHHYVAKVVQTRYGSDFCMHCPYLRSLFVYLTDLAHMTSSRNNIWAKCKPIQNKTIHNLPPRSRTNVGQYQPRPINQKDGHKKRHSSSFLRGSARLISSNARYRESGPEAYGKVSIDGMRTGAQWYLLTFWNYVELKAGRSISTLCHTSVQHLDSWFEAYCSFSMGWIPTQHSSGTHQVQLLSTVLVLCILYFCLNEITRRGRFS